MKTPIAHQNIFSITKGVLVCELNHESEMNDGLARQVKEHYPQVFDAFSRAVWEHNFYYGKILLVEVSSGLFVCCMASQTRDGYTYYND